LAWQDVVCQFDADGRSFSYRAAGLVLSGTTLGSGPALVLLGGADSTGRLFALLAWLLRERFTLVLPWHWCGDGRALSVDDCADALAGAVRQQGHASAAIYAAGYGGLVSLAALERHSHLFHAAVLQGAYARRSLTWAERVLAHLGAAMRWPLSAVPLREFFARANHRAWFPPFDATRWQFYLHETGAVPVAELAEKVRRLARTTLSDRLPRIGQPVLVLETEGQGTILELAANELTAALPRASSLRLPGTGLLPHLTHPHRLASAITEFLAGNPAAAS
jgi:pimeloyl-ACP methyl ester carboxylesterase